MYNYAKASNKFHMLPAHKHAESILIKLKDANAINLLKAEYPKMRIRHLFDGHVEAYDHGLYGELLQELSTKDYVVNVEPNELMGAGIAGMPHNRFNKIQSNAYVKIGINDMWYQYRLLQKRIPTAFIRTADMAVADAYFDTQHPQLDLILPGWNVANNTTNVDYRNFGHPSSLADHGTMCAGILCAKQDNLQGIYGLGYNARAKPISMTMDPSTNVSSANMALAIKFAADDGKRILSLSYGSVNSYSAIDDAALYSFNKGLLICCAAGNDTSSTVWSPARNNTVFGIGGLAPDANNIGTTQIDLVANYGAGIDYCLPYWGYSTYASMPYYKAGGTSHATPVFAALLSHILYFMPDYSFSDVRQLINKHVIRESFQASDPRQSSGFFGYGIPQYDKIVAELVNESGGIYVAV